jgi:hydroxymethylpyrimidine/phosphomethylpyrimidine kinase
MAPTILSSDGSLLTETDTLDALVGMMLPLTTLLILNSQEAQILSPSADSIEASASYLLEQGAEYVIITGSRDHGPTLTTTLFSHDQIPNRLTTERLNRSFQGAGSTLSAAIAAGFVHEREIDTIFNGAQQFTLETLKSGYRIGMGKELPNRFFWLEHEIQE